MKILSFIIVYIFNVHFLSAQNVDSFLIKIEPIICNCFAEIESFENLDTLGFKLEKCKNTYLLNKQDSTLIKTIGFKEYENRLFSSLRANCCAFQKIFSNVMNQSIEKGSITKSEVDSIKTISLIGDNLADNQADFNFLHNAIKIKITGVNLNNCNYPKEIFAINNGVTFRISSILDDSVAVSKDEFIVMGMIQDSGDVFVSDASGPYFFVYTAINLRTLEIKILEMKTTD